MKTKLLLIIMIILPAVVAGQASPAEKLFEKYSGQEGYTSVFISRHMFSLFSDLETGDKELESVFKNLTGIRILASDKAVPGVNFFNEIMKELPVEQYEELMVVREKGQDFRFLIRENNGMISELLMVAGGENNNVLISIQGNIDLNSISRLSRSMNIDGLNALEKIENNRQ